MYVEGCVNVLVAVPVVWRRLGVRSSYRGNNVAGASNILETCCLVVNYPQVHQ